MTLQIAFIGTGASPDDPSRSGYAMAYRHADAYLSLEECELSACADIVPENATAFADAFDVDHVYEDYNEMLADVRPDIVSVCVPPKAHANIVIGAAETGIPEAIHCEKPMAATWGECQEMTRVCEENSVQLTINHQRRFGKPFRKAKKLLEDGSIGDLRRIEFTEDNIFDAGTHLFDLAGYFTDQAPVEWVLGSIDYRKKNIWFGSHNENQALAQWRYKNGVYALAATGRAEDFVGCYLRLQGTDGTIEIGVHDGPSLRMNRTNSKGWKEIDTGGEDIHRPASPGLLKAASRKVSDQILGRSAPRTKPSYIDRAITDVVRGVRENTKPELSAQNALQTTEVIFAIWESARRQGRVELPLAIEDNPLEAMVEAGTLLGESSEPDEKIVGVEADNA